MFNNGIKIIIALMLSVNVVSASTVHAQKITSPDATRKGSIVNSPNTETKSIMTPKITPAVKETNPRQPDVVDAVLSYIEPEIQTSVQSVKTAEGAGAIAMPLILTCTVAGVGAPVMVPLTMQGGECVMMQSSEMTYQVLTNLFQQVYIRGMEMKVMNKLTESPLGVGGKAIITAQFAAAAAASSVNPGALFSGPCSSSSSKKSVLRAIMCQQARIQAAFLELTNRDELSLDKKNEALRQMEEDKLTLAAQQAVGSDVTGAACAAASSKSGVNEAAAKANDKYAEKAFIKEAYGELTPAALTATSGLDSSATDQFETSSLGAVSARLTANYIAFQLPDDETSSLKPVTFDEDGNIVGSIPDTPLPAVYKFDQVFPGGDLNYASMVLDRSKIGSVEHSFVADNAGINLINPIPESDNAESIGSSGSGSEKFIDSLAKRARYSIASDVLNFSAGLRSVSLPGDGSDTAATSKGANMVKNQLKQMGADVAEYRDIGDDISEYQFLDAMARRIPQAPGYYVQVANDDPIDIDKRIVRELAATLAVKWKQYQLLEKIIAIRATNLAVNVEQDLKD